MIFYSQDNGDKLPAADKWCDTILRDVGSPLVFVSPQDPVSINMAKAGQKVSSYAFNKALSGKDLDEVNPQTVIVFETDLGWNGSGGLKEALEFLEFFDGHAIAVGFAAGHIARISSPDQLRRLKWTP